MVIAKKPLVFNSIFWLILAIFAVSFLFVLPIRAGKDLKVGLFGVHQVAQHRSPYDNPLDPPRPLFRYAPGFAILQSPFLLSSVQTSAFEFKNMLPSIYAWGWLSFLSLAVSAFFLLKLIPSASKAASRFYLKLSILAALPLIGYELSNGQNKLIALSLMLAALFFFEKKKMLLSSVFCSLALTVYIPLGAFILYFFLRGKTRFLTSFLVGAFLIFLVLPSFVFGFDFNIALLKDWFVRCLKPFFLTTSYASYIDLRTSSQSLPSAIGRLFVWGRTGAFQYAISPTFVHFIIKIFSLILILASGLAVWRNLKENSKGLGYSLFFILALLLPQYCIYYSWSWLFVFYFAIFSYASFPDVTKKQKNVLYLLMILQFLSSWLISVHIFNRLSVLFWATLALFIGIALVLLGEKKEPSYEQ